MTPMMTPLSFTRWACSPNSKQCCMKGAGWLFLGSLNSIEPRLVIGSAEATRSCLDWPRIAKERCSFAQVKGPWM